MQKSPGSLAHYDFVSLYETSFKARRGDIRFFVDQAKKVTAPVLEYGAGAGRVTLPLARAGVDVLAVRKT
jgi:2-polyprenyl-3-methyl-5-hydroxy-6-metoxy-1,4-benzoquinol methylase